MEQHTPRLRSAKDTISNASGLLTINFLKLATVSLGDALTTCSHEIDVMKQELALIENSNLNIFTKDHRYFFRCASLDVSNQSGSPSLSGITGDLDRVHLLARRAFLENRIAAMELYSQKMKRILDSAEIAAYEARLSKKLGKFANANLDLCRIVFTKDQNEWINAPYTPNPYNRDSLAFETKGKVLVRSKSEAFIGSMLEAFGLPYRADDLVAIHADPYSSPRKAAPNRDTYFADFKVPNLLGGITIHEHLGGFHFDNYGENALRRLNDYHNYPVIELPGRPVSKAEFTWSFEDDLKDDASIRRLVAKLLLPGFF